jgi:hypothetical protein
VRVKIVSLKTSWSWEGTQVKRGGGLMISCCFFFLHAYRWLTGEPGRDCDPRFTPVSMVKSSCLVERKKITLFGKSGWLSGE